MNTSFIRALIAALALGTASAVSAPSVNAAVKVNKVGSGVSASSVKGDFEIESKVSDNLSVGANVDTGDSPLKSVFARLSNKAGNGNVGADLTMGLDGNKVTGDLKYSEGDNEWKASVNSGNDKLVDRVKYTKSGKGWKFAPTFHLKEKNVDLEASADYSADTNVAVKVAANGEGKVKVKHTVDADTALTFEGTGTDVNALTVEASRKVDASNTIKPKFEVGSKHLSVGWKHALEGGKSVTVNVNPEKSVGLDFEGADDEDWKAGVSAPWGDFKDADVSVGKKFAF